MSPQTNLEVDPESTKTKIQLVTFREFAALAKRKSWSGQSLAARFRGRIENPAEFFARVLSGKSPQAVIPYRSLIEFFHANQQSGVVEVASRPLCACGCSRVVFDRKKWATPGCRTRSGRKRVRNEQFWLGQILDFVEPKVRQKRRTGTLPLTERCDALRAD